MTEEKRSSVNYLSLEVIKTIHDIVSSRWEEEGEPIPPFNSASEANLDALIKLPQSSYFGEEQYPTLEGKAAIIFYTLNKKHLFSNGNKRMSVMCLSVFLILNERILTASPDELTLKAVWLANTSYDHDFSEIKVELERWIKENTTLHKL